MLRTITAATCLIAVLFCSVPAFAADEVTTVGVGTWKAGEKGGVDHITIDGENIYLNGVLQQAKFRPDADISIQNGVVVLIPRAAGKSAPAATGK